MVAESAEIKFFLSQHGFDSNTSLEPITNSASQRQYYRILKKGKSYILTVSQNIKENETFLYYTNCFEKASIRVPKVIAVSSDKTMYLQEDLGNQNFLDLIQNNDQEVPHWTQQILQDLAKINVDLAQEIDFKKSYEFQCFDDKMILNDLFYFKNYFLEYLEIPFQKQKLIDDFYAIAQQAEDLPKDFFMYRDFQSRNIMIHENLPYYIDYQGGLQGIACYDCVSFSWQAKANFDREEKSKIKHLYFENMQKISSISTENLEKSYQLSLIIRLFQLLGAYGFRGLVQGKKHFKESIQYNLKNIQYLVEEKYLEDFPELAFISQEYLTPEKIHL